MKWPAFVPGAGCVLLACGLGMSVPASAGEMLDWVDVTPVNACTRMVVHLNQPFLMSGHFPDRPTRYFYVLGQAAPDLLSGEGVAGGRERLFPPRHTNAGVRVIRYLGDLPALKLLLIETDTAKAFRVSPQQRADRLTITIASPGDMATCNSEEE